MAEPDEGSKIKADSESEDECEVLEESPCGRWQKRREEVNIFRHYLQKDISLYLKKNDNKLIENY